MRLLCMVAGGMLLQGQAVAGQRELTFDMLDIAIEVRQGALHLVDVALQGDGRLGLHDHAVVAAGHGEFAGVLRQVLEDGAFTAVFRIRQQGREYAGTYTIMSGSGAYAGARGQGTLETLGGHEAAASTTGVYRARLAVTTPDLRLSGVE